MRFLVTFIDMLRPDLCRMFEPTAKGGPIDDFLERQGGTFFRQAFTPAPITSRSLASFWSGLYPAKTGCTRSKRWPRDFMPEGLPNLFTAFAAAGYSIHCFLNRNEKVHGLLPPGWQERVQLNDGYDLEAFLTSVPKRDKQLIFVSLIDVHWFMTDHGYTTRNFIASQAIPARALANAGRIHPFDEFDAVVTFSDHGFQEGQWHECPWQERLARAKTGIALTWRARGAGRVQYDDKLRSIMDVVPTLLETAKLAPLPVDGINLFDSGGHDYVVHEDALDISVHGPRSEVDLWGMRVADGYVAMTDTSVHVASSSQERLARQMGVVPYVRRVRGLIARHSPTMLELDRDFNAIDDWDERKAWFRSNGGYPDPIFADGTPVERWADFLEERTEPPRAPADAQALLQAGLVEHQAGRIDAATRLYRQALVADPGSADAHHLDAVASYGRVAAARSICEFGRALAIAPSNINFLLAAAKAMLEGKAMEPAERVMRRALALEPGRMELRSPLASVGSVLYTRRHGRGDPRYLGTLYDDMGPRLAPNPYAVRLREWVAPLVGEGGDTARRRLLDLGCGTGPIGDEFHGLFGEIVGCDMSERSLRIAESKGRYHRLIRSDILAFLQNEPEGACDLVTAAGSFCYFGDLVELLRLCRRALRPGGMIAFTIFRSELPDAERDRDREVFGIFKHSQAYVERAAAAADLPVAAVGKDLKIFDEGKRDIVDDLYVLRKPE